MRRIIIYLILCFFTMRAYAEDAQTEVINRYVDQLVKEGSSILNDPKLGQDQKAGKIRTMILANLDLGWMARYTLGNYRRTLSTDQVNKFVEVYSKYVTKAYSDLVSNYKGEEGKVVRVTPISADEFMVEMMIVSKQEQNPIKVEYLVRRIKGSSAQSNLKVCDVITEGVSLINSQQGEFVRIISNDGFDQLISELNKKI